MAQSGEIKERVIAEAREILVANPAGLRYGELIRKIQAALPDVAKNTIHGIIWKWQKESHEVYKPGKGIYKLGKVEQPGPKRDTIREKVINEARKILATKRDGLSARELIKEIARGLPNVKLKTMRGVLSLWSRESGEVDKPRNNFYILRGKGVEPPPKEKGAVEEAFYGPFATFLEKEGECTKAIPLGGKEFKDKWGTPDVIGYREAARDHIYKPPLEVVSAEVKADDRDLITAFGQACAYKIFSHRAYVVVPRPSQEDVERLQALCMILGIGLVLHDGNANAPAFEIRIRAQKHEPDMEYVNRYLSVVKGKLGLR